MPPMITKGNLSDFKIDRVLNIKSYYYLLKEKPVKAWSSIKAGDRRTNFKYAVFKIANLLGLTSVTHGKLAHTVLRCRRQKKPCVI